MKFKKICLFVLLCFISFCGIYNVRAFCFEVRDIHSNNIIEYSTDNSKYNDSSKYKVTMINDTSKCGSFKNYDKNSVISCGNNLLEDVPAMLPRVIHLIYLFIEILVPVLLALFGTIDFVKAVVSGKDDDIKKHQQMFVKRLIISIFIFFTFAFAKLIVSFGVDGKDNSNNIISCASCLINNDSECKGG